MSTPYQNTTISTFAVEAKTEREFILQTLSEINTNENSNPRQYPKQCVLAAYTQLEALKEKGISFEDDDPTMED